MPGRRRGGRSLPSRHTTEDANSKLGLLKIDFRNAFNDHFVTCQMFPAMWTEWLFSPNDVAVRSQAHHRVEFGRATRRPSGATLLLLWAVSRERNQRARS